MSWNLYFHNFLIETLTRQHDVPGLLEALLDCITAQSRKCGRGKIKEDIEDEGVWRDFRCWQRPFAIQLKRKLYHAPERVSSANCLSPNSSFYGWDLRLKLTPVEHFDISGQKITQSEPPNNNCENKRATELAESQGQLQSLIKQGIMGLYGDYHYRPLCQSSPNIFCPPELMLNDSCRITRGRRTWGRIH